MFVFLSEGYATYWFKRQQVKFYDFIPFFTLLSRFSNSTLIGEVE